MGGFRCVAVLAAGVVAASGALAQDLGYYAEAQVLVPVLVREPEGNPMAAPPLLVALHGRGGNASEFANLWSALREPRPLLAVPQAPYPMLITGDKPAVGWSWFLLTDDRTMWKRADPLAVEHVLGVVRDLRAERKLGDVYLLGFSQGVSLAYLTAAQAPETIAGVIAFAGRLPTDAVTDETLRRAAGKVRVFIAHGEKDKAVKLKESERAREHLEKLGFEVVLRTFPGGHQLSEDLLREAQRWMAQTHRPPPA